MKHSWKKSNLMHKKKSRLQIRRHCWICWLLRFSSWGRLGFIFYSSVIDEHWDKSPAWTNKLTVVSLCVVLLCVHVHCWHVCCRNEQFLFLEGFLHFSSTAIKRPSEKLQTAANPSICFSWKISPPRVINPWNPFLIQQDWKTWKRLLQKNIRLWGRRRSEGQDMDRRAVCALWSKFSWASLTFSWPWVFLTSWSHFCFLNVSNGNRNEAWWPGLGQRSPLLLCCGRFLEWWTSGNDLENFQTVFSEVQKFWFSSPVFFVLCSHVTFGPFTVCLL